ncbi:MAG: hypothetical protein ACPIA2_19180, partial [Mariniblastus sp.]
MGIKRISQISIFTCALIFASGNLTAQQTKSAFDSQSNAGDLLKLSESLPASKIHQSLVQAKPKLS